MPSAFSPGPVIFVVYRSRADTMPSARALAKLRSSAAQPGAVADASPWPPHRPRALLQVSLPNFAPGRNTIVFSVAKSASISSVERSAAAASHELPSQIRQQLCNGSLPQIIPATTASRKTTSYLGCAGFDRHHDRQHILCHFRRVLCQPSARPPEAHY